MDLILDCYTKTDPKGMMKKLEDLEMKSKILVACALSAMAAFGMVGCGNNSEKTSAKNDKIIVVSREDGSGTRGAFIELFGIEQKDAQGKKFDMTTENASITNSTAVMMTTIAGSKEAIGYISLGSLNDTVKGVKIDGVEVSTTNVKNGSYKISRPFNIVLKKDSKNNNVVAVDFVKYILSKEGQSVIGKAGYIGNDNAADYVAANVKGKVVVAGSSSVTPVMEKLKEAYIKKNAGVNIEVQQSDSTTGVKAALSGICDIGMASRALKESEVNKGAESIVIAQDGIAVIVNKKNKYDSLTKAQVSNIFMGKLQSWNEIK